jgi:hypothetical protein
LETGEFASECQSEPSFFFSASPSATVAATS